MFSPNSNNDNIYNDENSSTEQQQRDEIVNIIPKTKIKKKYIKNIYKDQNFEDLHINIIIVQILRVI